MQPDNVPIIFKGLSEKDLAPVYGIGKVIKLKAGDRFIQEGDADQLVYVILEGSVKIEKLINDRITEIAVIKKGCCVGEIAFAKDARRTASAVALEPSTVMALDDKGLNTLPPNIRSVIFQNLRDIAAERICDLTQRVNDLSEKNLHLTSYVKDMFKSRSDLYAKSEMIQTVIKSFPRLPVYATRLAELLLEENVSMDEIIEFAKTDPSLVGVVLKVANSPYYNFPSKVADFQHALLLLGFNQVYQVVFDSSIGNLMPQTPEFKELRFHSLLISMAAFEISLICSSKKPLVMNTIGLLHGIGKSIILLLERDYSNLSVLLELLDDAKIGSYILKDWKLPDVICGSIEYHRYPEFAHPEEIPVEYREAVAILYLAHLCSQYLQGAKESEMKTAFFKEYMHVLNLHESLPALSNRIMTSLNKKLDTLPEGIRDLLRNAKP
jgi:HD-like signal output (HDOD) protein/CRP-like cAMP-binding protein